MGTISFSGLASGLDTATIIEQLMSIERRPIERLQAKVTKYQNAITMYNTLSTKFSSLKTAAAALDAFWEFNIKKATTSDEDVLTASASYAADVQSHSITVQQLACAESEVSQGYAATSDSVGTGVFRIKVSDSDWVEITLSEGHSSLQDLKNAINASDADVKASIINDGDASTPYRLVITGNETGANYYIELDTSGLIGGTTPVFEDGDEGEAGQKAQDAILLVDGITVNKSKNTITDLFAGVTLNLHSTSTSAVNLTIESDTDGLKEKINSFVTAYNDLTAFISTSKANSNYSTERSTLLQLGLNLRSVFNSSIEGLSGDYQYLSQVGLRVDANGELSFDESDFEDAIEDDFEGVMKLFSAFGVPSSSAIEFIGVSGATQAGEYTVEITEIGDGYIRGKINGHDAVSVGTSQLMGAEGYPEEGLLINFLGNSTGSYGTISVTTGFMELFERRLEQILDTENGTLAVKQDNLESRINRLELDIARKEVQLDKIEARYKRQFAQLETLLSSLQTQSTYLSNLSLYLSSSD